MTDRVVTEHVLVKERPVRFDRNITFSLILAILIQTGGALMWAGAAEARLKALEAHAMDDPEVPERLARLEAQMGMARQSLTRIERRLNHPEP